MGDFEIDAILNFIITKGGRVRNTELVTHFKNFLNHPSNKAHNREKFKDYVNELATIKLEAGDKILVLKRKYRPSSDAGPPSASTAPLPLTGAATAPKAARLPQHGGQLESSPPVEQTPTKSQQHHPEHKPESSLPAVTPREMKGQAPEPPRARSEPPEKIASTHGGSQDMRADGGGGEMAGTGSGRMAKARSEDGLERKQQQGERSQASLRVEDNTSASGSAMSLSSAASQESVGSSTSGISSLEDDPNASIMSVKDKVKKLNRIQSVTDVLDPKEEGNAKKGQRSAMGEDDESTHSSAMSYVTLTPEEKEWMVVCSTADYHDMNRLLSKNPVLTKLKDLTNGYTALHWAAKCGKPEVIKLVANRIGVNVDQRSHGGYTALHLAAIHGHEHIIELLVQTFKADPNLRDYSGKKAKQYLKNSASSKAQQLLVSRRLGSSDLNPLKGGDDSFIRSTSMRMSNRAKALLQVKSSAVPLLRSSWAGEVHNLAEEAETQEYGNTLTVPGDAPVQSSRKNSSRDVEIMPPPSSSMRARRFRYSDRSKSSSRESINSPRSGRKNEDSENFMPRSESDPILLEGSMV